MDHIEYMSPNTPRAAKVPQINAPVLFAVNNKVLRSSQLDYTIPAQQVKETGSFTFCLLTNATMISVPKDQQATARSPAAP